ncbi:collagen alpha-1(I) chain-like isoform X3 [Sorex araneus]|uniref:collagen alpha-1(I) chain-like isoform X3 n=1 Tax=Sorex araneus TaxID=42254 RepID=UPI002434011E|nr:collagen alpha-1(I) chain-like isoform X3 [Sorex araneus]XP_054993716.1 collagen alpha-1(I) chain-like isoform X3 [Sorex araneus]XP_054993717.1 collagen alpha-1(I) chain-like isoform X3 [Sorex araneus]XP_054993719.1 collagen alpha-1(I) chain-like isoform X3 [Sorex araneus]XP_054993720.1 collagen alpha-1(I) chain-like isoform X3 [Sorex araneus]XP_054993721.1 collagen alpha-1(I) chain-like isoform X3 [Sorex araneus]
MAAAGPAGRARGARDAGAARRGGGGRGAARPLSSLALPAAPRGALSHDPRTGREGGSPGVPSRRAAGLAERRRRRVHCGAAAGRGLRRAAAAAASEPLRGAGAAPPPLRSPVRARPSQSDGRAAGRGAGVAGSEGNAGGGSREEGARRREGAARGSRKRGEKGVGEGRPWEGGGRRARGGGGSGAGWALKCCISWGGAKLGSWPFPPPRAREGGAPGVWMLAVPHPSVPAPESGLPFRSQLLRPRSETGAHEGGRTVTCLPRRRCRLSIDRAGVPGTRHSRIQPDASTLPEGSGARPRTALGMPQRGAPANRACLRPSREDALLCAPLASSALRVRAERRQKVGHLLSFRLQGVWKEAGLYEGPSAKKRGRTPSGRREMSGATGETRARPRRAGALGSRSPRRPCAPPTPGLLLLNAGCVCLRRTETERDPRDKARSCSRRRQGLDPSALAPRRGRRTAFILPPPAADRKTFPVPPELLLPSALQTHETAPEK